MKHCSWDVSGRDQHLIGKLSKVASPPQGHEHHPVHLAPKEGWGWRSLLGLRRPSPPASSELLVLGLSVSRLTPPAPASQALDSLDGIVLPAFLVLQPADGRWQDLLASINT